MDCKCLIFILFIFQITCFSSSSSQPLCRSGERLSLLQFKDSFSFDEDCASPKVLAWKGSDCCSWDAVECDRNTGHVKGLDLSSSCLYGSLNSSSSLFDLAHLQKLNLALNDFNYSLIPSRLSNLSRLTYVNLSGSLFSGEIPSEISMLSSLSTLDLSSNNDYPGGRLLEIRSSDLKSLTRNLTSLQHLDLSDVDISSAIPTDFANLSSLMSLRLKNCGLLGSFPIGIFYLSNLQLLDMGNNFDLVGYLPEFHFKSQLQSLSLSSTSFSGELPASIGNLASMEFLDFSRCQFSGAIPSSIGNLTKLTFLNFRNNTYSGIIPPSFSNLTQLTNLGLGINNFSPSEIPSSFASMKNLELLGLCCNQFIGNFPSWLLNLTQLTYLNLGSNTLNGSLPGSLSTLQNLNFFDVESNGFSGIVKMDTLLELGNLRGIALGFNNFSLLISETHANVSSIPKFNVLGLSSCNLKEFPIFLRYQDQLQYLDLSFNNIQGKIPKWVWKISTEKLLKLDLSSNSLTGFDEPPTPLLWSSMLSLNISSNALQGSLPIPPSSTFFYSASKNELTGEISPLLCSTSSLQVLDLSYNNLSGTIPQCLGNFSESLSILNLHANSFSGPMPETWNTGKQLRMINLGRNKLRGKVPRSLSQCTMLEFLDLGNNQIKDNFPLWLEKIPELKILILHSNQFHGVIKNPSSSASVFPKLHIVDLSFNGFSGALPSGYFEKWDAMKTLDGKHSTYMHADSNIYAVEYKFPNQYDYSATLINKGTELEYAKISEMLTTIDLSSNRFEGDIPGSIGTLKGLQLLNLSNNILSGEIPPAVGDLTNLEALDMSRNMLVGRIPQILTELTFLGLFNVSYNNLTGAIPLGRQFDTFENSSFVGNSALCGKPLSKECQDSGSYPGEETDESSKFSDGFGWKAVFMGYGSGFVVGVVIGHVVFTRRHDWFVKIFGEKKGKRRRQWRRN